MRDDRLSVAAEEPGRRACVMIGEAKCMGYQSYTIFKVGYVQRPEFCSIELSIVGLQRRSPWSVRNL
jgi:hypothetical protein